MTPTAYVETSAVSYLTARTSRDVVTAAYRAVTRDWWRLAPDKFELVASALVISEAGAGDPEAARARLEAREAVTLLDATMEVERLAQMLLDTGAIPRRAAGDAAHVAVAAANGADYLVTWNFRHIANAATRSRIERACRQAGFEPPVNSPPSELVEAGHANDTDGSDYR